MSVAKLPRSKSGGQQPKLAATSKESGCKKKKTAMNSGSLQHQFSGKSTQDLVKGDHPWSGVAEALLRPLPADWRHNIETAFSNLGEALGRMLGGGQQGGHRQVGRGRRGGF